MALTKNICVLAAWVLLAGQAGPCAAGTFTYRSDHVLGTSLDLTLVVEREAEANAVERTVLGEIERLKGILSTWDECSEIGKLNRTMSPVACSRELRDVLNACEKWQLLTGGAFSAQAGGLTKLWRDAARAGSLPNAEELESLARVSRRINWRIDSEGNSVRRLRDQPLDVDAIAKGYIIDRAVEAVRERHRDVHGMLLDLGGDIRAFGGPSEGAAAWRVGVADPTRPADNVRPPIELHLADRAVATSGSYARPVKVGGTDFSHIVDPRTGQPARSIASATVVAPDAAAADALATAFMVLTPARSLLIAREIRGVECLIVEASGRAHTSPGWAGIARPSPAAPEPVGLIERGGGRVWPSGVELRIELTLASSSRRRKSHRPYVVVWIENRSGDVVRTLELWGRERKYLKELRDWYRHRNRKDDPRTVTRASRRAGNYRIVWDGKDINNKPVPAGDYTVHIETAKEKGRRIHAKQTIPCGARPARASIPKNGDIQSVSLIYDVRKT